MDCVTKEQFNEIEDLLQHRYGDFLIGIHQLIHDECHGYPLYEFGHPWDLGEFIKNHSSAFDKIVDEILNRDEVNSNDDDSEEY